jgi:hypothetical protein
MNVNNFLDYLPMLTHVMKHVCVSYYWDSQFVSFSMDIFVNRRICDQMDR